MIEKNEIKEHKFDNEEPIKIFSLSEKDSTVNNFYCVGFVSEKSARFNELAKISFQNGDPKVNGINGLTIEALLAICHHRLSGFQRSNFACTLNAQALESIEGALDALKKKTETIQKGIKPE